MRVVYNQIAATLLLLSFLGSVHAQTDSVNNKLFYRSQIKFALTGCLFDNLQLTWYGEKLLRSRPLPSGEVSISYYTDIKNGYGLNVGFGLGLAPYNFHYLFKIPENSIFFTPNIEVYEADIDHYEYIQEYYTFPLSVQKTFVSKKRNKLRFIEAGIKLNYKVAYPSSIKTGVVYKINDTTEARLFQMMLRSTSHRVLVSGFFKYGWQRITKRQNTFQYGFVLHYSPSKIGMGDYEFSNLTYPSYGTIFQNINYIGFEVVYGLATSRRIKDW
jgi:hypothetical protein